MSDFAIRLLATLFLVMLVPIIYLRNKVVLYKDLYETTRAIAKNYEEQCKTIADGYLALCDAVGFMESECEESDEE